MELTRPLDETIVIRNLRPADLEAVIALDAGVTGHRRAEYLKHKLELNRLESSVNVSLAAERDGRLVGFLLTRVYYGEFGVAEPVAVLDTLGVHADFRGQGVGSALMDQLKTNLRGLGVPRLSTEVDWDDQRLLAFFHREGFRPAQRLCLDVAVEG